MTKSVVLTHIIACALDLEEKHDLKFQGVQDLSPGVDGKGDLRATFTMKFTYDPPETPKG